MSHTKSSRYKLMWGRTIVQWSPLINRITIERCQTVCLWLVVFVLLTALKQFIYLKWPLNIINHVSHSYLSMSSRIKHDWFFLFFVNSDRHIFPQKTRTWSERLRLLLQSFLFKVFDITITMDISLIYNS